ncbi:DASH family cryptochrome [Allohahella marinimesophila]|uniref:Cryptochrome DASH n=1 Tax=Allohahella marinimesophila TaxID=1054972 RepID=A0ABP7NQA3_9GAMM
MITGLFLFQNDLRLEDNPALQRMAREVDHLFCVYLINASLFSHTELQLRRIGYHRWRFLLESLYALDSSLWSLGQELHVFYGQPRRLLPQVLAATGSTTLGLSAHPGPYENDTIEATRQYFPDLTLVEEFGSTLFEPEQLPFELPDMPDGFTPFRKLVEGRKPRRQTTLGKLPAAGGVESLRSLVPLRVVQADDGSLLLRRSLSDDSPPDIPQLHKPEVLAGLEAPVAELSARLRGGAGAGLEQLNYYTLQSRLISRYKETRNDLDGWDFSSKLSPWLAAGCLSPVQVAEAVFRYEAAHGSNESTYWLYFELLWREYYQWLLYKYGKRLFTKKGIQQKRKLTTFYPQAFKSWCEGSTEWPIVNAAMRQLKLTGWMSNRARQLVASCLVNELQVDWRYGAAWFEQWLVDYDVASNWGNWQYLAGVGTDPRGQRRFNLQEQAERYDPDGSFADRWKQ